MIQMTSDYCQAWITMLQNRRHFCVNKILMASAVIILSTFTVNNCKTNLYFLVIFIQKGAISGMYLLYNTNKFKLNNTTLKESAQVNTK